MAIVNVRGQTGGGAALPATIAAGDTVIYAICAHKVGAPATDGVFEDVGTGYGFTALKAGTYRFVYNVRRSSTGLNAQMRLTKNGTEVSGSLITNSDNLIPTYKTMDVSLAANDVIRLQWEYYIASNVYNNVFVVSILAADIQTELNKAGTPL